MTKRKIKIKLYYSIEEKFIGTELEEINNFQQESRTSRLA